MGTNTRAEQDQPKKIPLKKCCPYLTSPLSGSPIVQNGMLVGSVTHVFVKDPTRGFGIFAENIQENAQNELINMKNAA